MKKIVSTVLVCVMLLSCVLVLASCGKTLSGSYEHIYGSETAGYKVTYTFNGSEVEVSRQLISALGSTNPTTVTGKYEIAEDDDGNMTITFDFSGEETEEGVAEEGTALAFSEGNEGNTKFIKIGGVQFNKVD